MMMWLTGLTVLQQLLIGLPPTVAALFFLWRKVLRPMRDFVRSLRTMVTDVQDIKKYIGPNGGKSLTDKTDRNSKAIKILDARLSTVLDVVVDQRPMFQADERGYYTWVNTALERLFETTADHMSDHGWVNLILPEDRDRVVREWKHAVADRRAFTTLTRSVTQVHMTALRVRWRAQPVFDDPFDLPIAWVGTIDILQVQDDRSAA